MKEIAYLFPSTYWFLLFLLNHSVRTTEKGEWNMVANDSENSVSWISCILSYLHPSSKSKGKKAIWLFQSSLYLETTLSKRTIIQKSIRHHVAAASIYKRRWQLPWIKRRVQLSSMKPPIVSSKAINFRFIFFEPMRVLRSGRVVKNERRREWSLSTLL